MKTKEETTEYNRWYYQQKYNPQARVNKPQMPRDTSTWDYCNICQRPVKSLDAHKHNRKHLERFFSLKLGLPVVIRHYTPKMEE